MLVGGACGFGGPQGRGREAAHQSMRFARNVRVMTARNTTTAARRDPYENVNRGALSTGRLSATKFTVLKR